MPALNETELVQFQDWTLRIRRASERPARLLLMVHGLTGDESSMWVFAHDLPADLWILAPRAPYAARPAGYSWQVEHQEDERRPTFETLLPSVGPLLDLVDQYAASVALDAGTFDLMGFSQGAAVGSLLAMLHPERVRKLAVLAGFVPAGAEMLLARRPLDGKKLFVAHGTRDVMVPVDRARDSIELLEQAGAQVTYCEEEVGHKVGAGCLRALKSYLLEAH